MENCGYCNVKIEHSKYAARHRQFCNLTCRYRFRRKNRFCVKCNKKLPKKIQSVYCPVCKEDQYKHIYVSRLKSPDKYLETQNRFRVKRRAIMDELKSSPCIDCNKSFPPYCMDFDHRDPITKKFIPSQGVRRSIKALLEEIEKCDLVCANCHRIRSHAQGF